jgi:hypothetical protein
MYDRGEGVPELKHTPQFQGEAKLIFFQKSEGKAIAEMK